MTDPGIIDPRQPERPVEPEAEPTWDEAQSEISPAAPTAAEPAAQPASDPTAEPAPNISAEPNLRRLIRRAIAGDDGAFATLIEHYDAGLRELAFHLLGDHEGMEHATRVAYLKAYRALPRLTRAVRAAPWLYRITYLVCLDELRRRQRRPRRKQPPPSATGTQSDQADDLTPSTAFAKAFANLPADHRATVLMVDSAGLDLASVAEVLDRPEAVARKVLTRARAFLQAALDEDAAPLAAEPMEDPEAGGEAAGETLADPRPSPVNAAEPDANRMPEADS